MKAHDYRSSPSDAGMDLSILVADVRPTERGKYLREIMAFAAGGLVALEGQDAASEAAYRVADAVVSRGGA